MGAADDPYFDDDGTPRTRIVIRRLPPNGALTFDDLVSPENYTQSPRLPPPTGDANAAFGPGGSQAPVRQMPLDDDGTRPVRTIPLPRPWGGALTFDDLISPESIAQASQGSLRPGVGLGAAPGSGAQRTVSGSPMPTSRQVGNSTGQIVHSESGGNPNARNPNSSASGVGQFLDGTWLDMLRRHRKDLYNSLPRDQLLQLKGDPDLAREMVDAYVADNSAFLRRQGLPVTVGTQYLAHFAGPGGAAGLLRADPSTPAIAALGPKVVQANPFLARMNAGQVMAWADQQMGVIRRGPSSSPMSITAP